VKRTLTALADGRDLRGAFVNDVLPEEAARMLREVIGEPAR
jgi:hypothetical protein